MLGLSLCHFEKNKQPQSPDVSACQIMTTSMRLHFSIFNLSIFLILSQHLPFHQPNLETICSQSIIYVRLLYFCCSAVSTRYLFIYQTLSTQGSSLPPILTKFLKKNCGQKLTVFINRSNTILSQQTTKLHHNHLMSSAK